MSSTFTDSSGVIRLQGTAGGAVPVDTESATVETDPDDFFAREVFDLGHVTMTYVRMTLLAVDGDGETWGDGMGDVSVYLSYQAAGGPAVGGVSRDGVEYVQPTLVYLHSTSPAGAAFTVGDYVDGYVPTPRYVAAVPYIIDSTSGDIYAGANHPVATVRLDYEYV
jgi:hypothetical protein